MYRTHAEPNWRTTGWGQPEIEKTEMKSKQDWFCLLVVFLTLSALSALVIFGIFHLPLEFGLLFLAFATISVLMNICNIICKCCVKKKALDTQTGTRNETRTRTRNRIGNGTTGNLNEFILYDSNRGSVLETSNLPSPNHFSTYNYTIPTISSIYLSDTLSEPSNSVGANVPSAPPLEGSLFLPSYDEVINQSNYEIEEEPPPTYDEVVLKINSNLWPKIKMLSK